MALIRVDWNPSANKVRQFGLILFSLSVAASWRHWAPAPAGVVLGALAAALPGSAGLWIYKAWMGVAFVIGSILSPVILGVIYFGLFTPLALLMKLAGRDALKLKRPQADTYWSAMDMPEDKKSYERLF